jgi:Uma2 family endonuclease
MKITGSFEPRSHRFSVAEYYHLGELGLLSKRTELIHGIIIDMEPIAPLHADIVDILTQAFIEQAHGQFRVRVQEPIDLDPESLPQPDLVLCQPVRYRDRHPAPADISLVVEVADTTLDFDLADKRALYAGTGIPEYWIINLRAGKLTRFVQGGVEQPVTSATLSPVAFPGVSIDLADLFG